MKEIALNFKNAFTGSTPSNYFITGSTGTGKTATILRVLKEVEKRVAKHNLNIKTAYTVAENSQMRTLISLCNYIGLDVPEKGLGFSDVKNKFLKNLNRCITIVIIDEIDKLVNQDSYADLMYFLSRDENICLIGISNMVTLTNSIKDKRILSSWNPVKTVFKGYDLHKLKDILKYRSKLALNEGVIDDEVLEYIAMIATRRGGDARYALDFLMSAGDIADAKKQSKITTDNVEEAIEKVEEEFIKSTVRELKEPEKALLCVFTMSEDGVNPNEAYDMANNILYSITREQLKQRRWADYRNNLELYGYVLRDIKGKGKGKGFQYNYCLNPELEREMIYETIIEEFSNYMSADNVKSSLNSILGVGG